MSRPAAQRKPPAGHFGVWLDGMMRSRRWTQADLGRVIGKEPSMVSKWVRGARVPDNPNCEAIARAFGVPPYEVLALAGRAPALTFAPVADPRRARAHALIDATDPVLLETLLPLLTHLAAVDPETQPHDRPTDTYDQQRIA